MALSVIMRLVYSLIIIFNTTAPFLIQGQFHYSSIFFGHIAFCLGLAFLITTFVCRHLVKINEASTLFKLSIHIYFSCALLAVILSYFLFQSITLIIIASLLMFSASGFLFPLSMGTGLSMFRHIAGTATATMYLINILITGLMSFLVSFVMMHNAIPLMWLYFLLLSGAVIVYWAMMKEP